MDFLRSTWRFSGGSPGLRVSAQRRETLPAHEDGQTGSNPSETPPFWPLWPHFCTILNLNGLLFHRNLRFKRRFSGQADDFSAEEYDVDGSGAVGWYEFVTVWRKVEARQQDLDDSFSMPLSSFIIIIDI